MFNLVLVLSLNCWIESMFYNTAYQSEVENKPTYNWIHIEHTQPANHTSPNSNHNSTIGDQYSFKCNQNVLKSWNSDVQQKCAGQKKLTNRVPITTKLLPKQA